MAGMSAQGIAVSHKQLSGRAIAAAIEVHQRLGPGFLESVYEAALCVELDLRGIRYERQKQGALKYRGRTVGEHRLDLPGVLVVELKAVKAWEDIFFATTRSSMKAVEGDDGMLLNFASMPLTVKRVGREQARLPIGGQAHYRKGETLGQSGNQELREEAAQAQPPSDFLSS